jgi:hypothetical protein
MMKRGYEQGAEFKARQGQLDFAQVALAVLEIAVEVKKTLCRWWKAARPAAKKIMVSMPIQMNLFHPATR